MIIGKWVLISNEEYYNSGLVMDLVAESFMLIRIRPPNKQGPTRMGLFDLMAAIYETESVFFDTEEQLDAFIAWLDTPEGEAKLKVVSINKKEGEK